MAADMLDDCALVIMAKAPRAGHVKTRLAQVLAPEAIVALYRCLIEDTLALARAVGAPRIAVVCPAGHEDELAAWLGIEVIAQEGDGLAAALESAFHVLLGAGCRRVIAFDGDSPHVPAETLSRAFALLERHDLVVGPTADGGYYFVGATRAHRGLFDGGGIGTGCALRSPRSGTTWTTRTTSPGWRPSFGRRHPVRRGRLHGSRRAARCGEA